jgi:hypothetical protein
MGDCGASPVVVVPVGQQLGDTGVQLLERLAAVAGERRVGAPGGELGLVELAQGAAAPLAEVPRPQPVVDVRTGDGAPPRRRGDDGAGAAEPRRQVRRRRRRRLVVGDVAAPGGGRAGVPDEREPQQGQTGTGTARVLRSVSAPNTAPSSR